MKNNQTGSTRRAALQADMQHQCEAEVAEGLEEYARDEIGRRFGERMRLYKSAGRGVLRFGYSGDLGELLSLQAVQAVYLVRTYPVPRPRGLLGDEHLRAILAQIASVRRLSPPGTFRTIYVSAAGAESSVMMRFKAELMQRTGFAVAAEEGDLLIRLRRSADEEGWDVLMRLSPRPLSTRAWRACNMEGALNATVAHVMARLTNPRRSDVFLNIACGSGTLMIERLAVMPARRVIGCDISAAARQCAATNVAASPYKGSAEIHDWDARELPLADSSVDAICADLPFGHLVGSHNENVTLYPPILREAARVAKQGAIFALITHEIRLMENVLAESQEWEAIETVRVGLGGLYPRIFVLRRL